MLRLKERKETIKMLRLKRMKEMTIALQEKIRPHLEKKAKDPRLEIKL